VWHLQASWAGFSSTTRCGVWAEATPSVRVVSRTSARLCDVCRRCIERIVHACCATL
jgi:hypothetical protein